MQPGDKIGQWTLIEKIPGNRNHPRWMCRCSCGTTRPVQATLLRTGSSRSCGCARWGVTPTSHGESRSKLYRVWSSMLDRCYLETCDRYPTYGGRGISVCEEWQLYLGFRTWALASGYREGLSIDRTDVNGNYEPNNCIWDTPDRQQRNTQKTVWVTAWDERKALPDWIDDERCTAKYSTVYARLQKGWRPEDAIGLPYGARGRVPKVSPSLNRKQFEGPKHFDTTASLDELTPYAHGRSDQRVNALARRIKSQGYKSDPSDPINLVHHEGGSSEIGGGNHRVLALQKLGYSRSVPIRVHDYRTGSGGKCGCGLTHEEGLGGT